MSRQTLNGYGLLLLAAGLVINSVLGPLLTGVIDYRFTESLINQGIGLDFVSLVLVAPVSVVAAVMLLRRQQAGYVLGIGPALYAAYMSVQYSIGPDYTGLEGNNEQFVPFHLALFILSVVLTVGIWHGFSADWIPPLAPRARRLRAWLIMAIGALLFVRYLPLLAEIVAGEPTFTEYEENATSFLLIMWMDIGIFVPLAIGTGFGLRAAQTWAIKGLYAVTGWFAFVGPAVAAMAVTMHINEDPDAASGMTAAFIVAAVVVVAIWLWLVGPLLQGVEKARR